VLQRHRRFHVNQINPLQEKAHMSNNLTRGATRNVQPKLPSAGEKEKARKQMQKLVNDFIKDGGVIEEVPIGTSGLENGATKKQRANLFHLSTKGKAGQEALKKIRGKKNESTSTQAGNNKSA
tara:strand:- start:290 stop:658 length:369 start_codon:yes stop_codon:yes gene_type:complete